MINHPNRGKPVTKITRAAAKRVAKIINAGLVHGLGDPKPGQVCIEAAICLGLGLPHGDKPACVARSLRAISIRINDRAWSSDVARAEGMRRLGIAQLGSAGFLDESEFIKAVLGVVIRKSFPTAFRAVAAVVKDDSRKAKWLDLAGRCEAAPEKFSPREARQFFIELKETAAAYAAAAYAADAAAAYAAAADAAYAAAAAADAADAAAAYAAAAAAAYAAAADAAAAAAAAADAAAADAAAADAAAAYAAAADAAAAAAADAAAADAAAAYAAAADAADAAAADAAAAYAAYAAAAYAADAAAAYAADAAAAYAAAAYAADAAAYAAYAAAGSADAAAFKERRAVARDKSLAAFCEEVVQVLIAMKAPGCRFLDLAPFPVAA